jgi:hypothetical protein
MYNFVYHFSMNCFARISLDYGKGIAVRSPAQGVYELRLLQGGKGFSGVVELKQEVLPSIRNQSRAYASSNVGITWRRGSYVVTWKGKEFAVINGGAWGELLGQADAIREGATEVTEAVFGRTGVQIVQVRDSADDQDSQAADA